MKPTPFPASAAKTRLKLPPSFLLPILGLDLAISAFTGCVSKAKAKSEAQSAFIAGQQQAMARMMQSQSRTVSFIGQVKMPSVPWTEDLTLAKAIVTAGYVGARDPKEIMIVRNGQAIPVSPGQLLSGEDIPLQSGDMVIIKQ
jgi:protein involved in polysaccharide export with SLBB domain